MKRFISILLILTLVMSVFTVTSISSFAEDTEDPATGEGTPSTGEDGEGTGTETPPPSEGGEGEEGGDGTQTPPAEGGEGEEGGDGTETPPTEGEGDGYGETAPKEENDYSNPINDFLEKHIPFNGLEDVKEVLFKIIDTIWDFVTSEETYKDITTLLPAILVFLAMPIVIGLLVIVYAAIGAMIMFAGALTAVVDVVLTITGGALK